MIDTAFILKSLLPVTHVPVMDLVDKAGIGTAQWHSKNKGISVKNPRANPKFCYEWAFGGEAEPIALCIWHRSLTTSDGKILCTDNLRNVTENLLRVSRDNSTDKSIRDSARRKIPRAKSFDHLVGLAFKNKLSLRAIIVDEIQKGSKTSKNRLLDDEPWHVASYDDKTGDFRLVRGENKLVKTTFFDQFSITETAQLITTKGSVFLRSREVRNAVLLRAGGICEHCGVQGFMTSDGGFYLETHHVIPLSENGSDHTSNVVAICANDHRMAHHSLQKKEMRASLLKKLTDLQMSSTASNI